ncbi:MAG: ACP S-malonyltransferase [Candidatus Eremiobacteraeota bacterium]|nr:ACP S-malonyltransferase [Candidatus Eremiobacteraeota bacterium]
MKTRVAAIFPGQGSQSLGMGTEIARTSPAALELFTRAGEILGYDLLKLVHDGPEERLRETMYSQPAIFVTNCALYYAAAAEIESVVSAGHSFGELCSLTISDSLSFDAALRIVDERGKAMQHAAELAPGAMAAVIGMTADDIRHVVADSNVRCGQSAQLANFNSPSQIVISGDREAVRSAGDALLEAGAKRVVPLNVSGAWHSALMEPAIERFSAAVETAEFSLPRFDVISNVDAKPYRDVAAIRRNLVRSITSEVRWHETAELLVSYEVDAVVEFGAGPVLGPLVKRLAGAPTVLQVSDSSGIEKLRTREWAKS